MLCARVSLPVVMLATMPAFGGDGFLGSDDLLRVVASWGTCPQQPEGCPADLDEDGTVGINDLLTVVMNWAGEPSGPIPTGLGPNADLDIKPGSCPNPLNRRSHGYLPVALVSTRGPQPFDATHVDLSTVVLLRKDKVGGAVSPNEGPPGPHSVFEDVATPFSGKSQCACAVSEGDGLVDLSLKFNIQELVSILELDDVPPGETVALIVRGELVSGESFQGTDCVVIVPHVSLSNKPPG